MCACVRDKVHIEAIELSCPSSNGTVPLIKLLSRNLRGVWVPGNWGKVSAPSRPWREQRHRHAGMGSNS